MRAVVIDALSGRQVLAGPEETDATQPLAFYLTQRLGWNPRQIMTRPQWRVPKSPSGHRHSGYPVDLAIFDAPGHLGDPAHVRILCECKSPNVEDGIDQLKIYLGLEPEARLGIWFNGRKHVLVYKLLDQYVVSEYASIPRPNDPLSPTSDQPPLRFCDLKPPPNMAEIFRRLRDQIASQDTKVNRDEYILNDLANLLVCKIADEQMGESDPQRHLGFQSAGNPSLTAHAIRAFFDNVKQRLPSVFTDETDRIHIDDASLSSVVRGLEQYRLLGHDRHAVGTAFQILRGRAMQNEEGAYFTPPPVVDCVVRVLSPDHKTRMLDSACGTGGFLAAALDHVFEAVDKRDDLSSDVKGRTKRDWAQNSLNAVDKDFVSTKLCKAYLTLLGDGRAHVFRANMIDRQDWASRDDVSRAIADDSFDMILTNPPFGKNLVVTELTGRRENLRTCQQWAFDGTQWEPTGRYIDQQIGLPFFERDMALLKEGGRLAIVLPETFLFSKSFRWFVDWVCSSYTITHIVDVPMVAFEEYCRAKTCILFVTKMKPTAGHFICMSYPKSIGQDRKGNLLYRLDSFGSRTGALDNEMADAVQVIVDREYRGEEKKKTKNEDERYCFRVSQKSARLRGILVPRFWWRKEIQQSLRSWIKDRPSTLITLGELVDKGILETFEGHGSPPGNARATGEIPYVKVTDLKNWRINENPTNFVHIKVAEKLKKGKNSVALQYADLVTPARASSNIGQFSLVLPWQTNILLTKEVLVLRVKKNDLGISAFLLLALLSLKVVQEQYKTLVLMQTNREHLGDHWREISVPIPSLEASKTKIEVSVKSFFEGIVKAHDSLRGLDDEIDPTLFGSRP